MELNNTTPTLVKTPEAESETPTRIQSSNGVLKRHAPIHHHHPVVVTYKECLKNFAASLGGHSLDGCGEFMSSTSNSSSSTTTTTTNQLMCAVCGCHRNFHRRETEDISRPVLEFQSYNRHNSQTFQQPKPTPSNSPSPPPISSAYYPSGPHMLMALSHGTGTGTGTGQHGSEQVMNTNGPVVNSSRKRHRTKFTMEQKGRMVQFAERLGWKMQKKDDGVINEFCNEVGVERGVFKVWMHNNKNTVGVKDVNVSDNKSIIDGVGKENGVGFGYQEQGNGERKKDGEMGQVQNHVRANVNGSSSS